MSEHRSFRIYSTYGNSPRSAFKLALLTFTRFTLLSVHYIRKIPIVLFHEKKNRKCAQVVHQAHRRGCFGSGKREAKVAFIDVDPVRCAALVRSHS